MVLRIHHPRLLVGIVLVIVTITSVTGIWAAGQQRDPEQVPVFPAVPIGVELTDDDKAKVVSIVKTSGVVKMINGDQDWQASAINGVKIDGKEAAKLVAAWDTPVSSSGPWLSVRCQGHRKVVTTNEIGNVHLLTVYVDMEDETVIAYSVRGPGSVEASANPGSEPVAEAVPDDHSVKVYDFKTGDLVFDGPLSDLEGKLCEEGTHDD